MTGGRKAVSPAKALCEKPPDMSGGFFFRLQGCQWPANGLWQIRVLIVVAIPPAPSQLETGPAAGWGPWNPLNVGVQERRNADR